MAERGESLGVVSTNAVLFGFRSVHKCDEIMATHSPHSTAHTGVANINFHLLRVVREVATANRPEALMRFGLDDALLDAIIEADTAALEEFCQSGKVAFRPAFNAQDLLASAIRAGVAKPARGGVNRAQ